MTTAPMATAAPRTMLRTAGRQVTYAALAFPLAVGVCATLLVAGTTAALGLDRRGRRRWLADDGPVNVKPGRLFTYGVVSIAMGLALWFVLLLMIPNTLRNLAYPLSNPTAADYSDAWGGPTLAGAWAVHAALALALVPIYLLVLRSLIGLQRRVREWLLHDRWIWWVAPVTVIVIGGLTTFLVALLRQL